jgi:hypothetical protein
VPVSALRRRSGAPGNASCATSWLRRRVSRRGREYGKALTAYERASEKREAELGRALDRAYANAMAATNRERTLREELEAL